MEQKIKTKLQSKTKPLSASSIDLYIKQLKKLNDNQPLKDFKFLQDPQEVLSKIEKYKPNTRRNKLISIVSTLKEFPTYKKLYKIYYDLMLDEAKTIQDNNNGEKSETQKENWLEWTDILNFKEQYCGRVNQFKNKKNLTQQEYTDLLKCLVLSLYSDLPPRRNKDYQLMLISNTDKNLNPQYNYFVKDKFIFQNYKTKKSIGVQEVKIPDSLMNVIKIYLKFYPNKDSQIKFFLVNYDGQEFKNINSLTYFINSIFGKKISSSMLRHIYLSKYKDIKEEQKQDAELMAHSLATQKEYIKK